MISDLNASPGFGHLQAHASVLGGCACGLHTQVGFGARQLATMLSLALSLYGSCGTADIFPRPVHRLRSCTRATVGRSSRGIRNPRASLGSKQASFACWKELEEEVIAGGRHGWASLILWICAIAWLKRFRETGNVEPGQMGGHKPKAISGAHHDWLIYRFGEGLHLARAGDGTGRARPEGGLPLGLGVRPCREAVAQKKTLIAAEQDRPDVARRRAQWTRYRNRVDPSRLVFIDETWTKTNMA